MSADKDLAMLIQGWSLKNPSLKNYIVLIKDDIMHIGQNNF